MLDVGLDESAGGESHRSYSRSNNAGGVRAEVGVESIEKGIVAVTIVP